jgi:hypothetical protein
MLTIQIDGIKAVTDRFDEMTTKIEQLRSHDLAHELADWEVQDLNRRRPYTKHRRNGGSTIVRAHSWFEVKGRRKVVRKLIRKGRYVVPRRSTRPVLRPFLLDQLSDRIEALAEASLKW